MKKGAIFSGAFILLLLLAVPASAENIELTFSVDSLEQFGQYQFAYPGLKNININESLSIPVKTLYFKGNMAPADNIAAIFSSGEKSIICEIPPEYTQPRDIQTALDQPNKTVSRLEALNFADGLFDLQTVRTGNETILAVTISPLSLDQSGNLIFNGKINLELIGEPFSAPLHDLLTASLNSDTDIQPVLKSAEKSTGLPLNTKMIIITSPDLASIYERLAVYKNIIGLTTAIAVTDSIYASYEGDDSPARIRAYLKDFHAGGGQFVLLGGDDINLPIRYLYYYNTSSAPTDPYLLMPSDLYYADLNGVWDKDGDGVFGEPNQDEPDLIPELKVGRIPLRDPEAINNFIDKLIQYQTDPGNGDFSYLSKQLYFSSDQMRDYPTGGQHNYIAQTLPSFVQVDTGQTVELPDGYDSNPVNPDGNFGVEKISEGYGFIHMIAHGRVDGFRVKAAYYGDWPSSNILTLPISDYHGCLDDLEQNGKTSLYYSLSCQVGGFDLDSIDHQSADISFVERIMGAPQSGAIAMVGNTRWGWVYSSYFLQESFTRHLYDDAEGSPVEAMYLSWLDYPYYRDLIYGQNFYGDPSADVYLDEPQKMTANAWPTENGHLVEVKTDGNIPVEGADILLSLNGEIIESGTTDDSGIYYIQDDLDYGTAHTICIIHDGYNIGYRSYTPSLVTDVDDDYDSALPEKFAVAQNYPNPFNPATTIAYDLPERATVELSIYNILGQLVYTEQVHNQEPGTHEIDWEARDASGQFLPSGLYLYRIEANGISQTKKMMLLK